MNRRVLAFLGMCVLTANEDAAFSMKLWGGSLLQRDLQNSDNSSRVSTSLMSIFIGNKNIIEINRRLEIESLKKELEESKKNYNILLEREKGLEKNLQEKDLEIQKLTLEVTQSKDREQGFFLQDEKNKKQIELIESENYKKVTALQQKLDKILKERGADDISDSYSAYSGKGREANLTSAKSVISSSKTTRSGINNDKAAQQKEMKKMEESITCLTKQLKDKEEYQKSLSTLFSNQINELKKAKADLEIRIVIREQSENTYKKKVADLQAELSKEKEFNKKCKKQLENFEQQYQSNAQ
ncbi:hypothetical protein [Candidatus Hydrogenosomobacter endosymbioticus]|uniref:Uncharacterized protein n=1 Tax=Candidatus Hydrogenosomobacter endosymbioticus TaxID=2558174 RepID=A0ABM7V9C3_9PROT|nr:hypothetical protein [Candidatus Hydrogenosomobacter endosymbioticus]BDB96390.1 hypothetical protein HYD_5230 [Candidatus Hydrogenosomobacter endosymbioticus]